jgi:O-antigen/teichoic acid export membrane protein
LNIDRTIFAGSLWAIGMRWGIRLIGLASVAVLARVLRPEDFGILAMAMLVVALLESWSDLGVAAMLIREPKISDVDLNTAWTLKILQGLFFGVLVLALASPAALHFREPRLTEVIYLCALALLVASFENIGVVLIRRELDFAKDFRYQVVVKLISVAITVSLALSLRSYWALALAQPINAALAVLVSYAMSSYRPRLGLRGWRRFLRFSANVSVGNVALLINNKADSFLVGSVGTAAQMGSYSVASELSSMPSRELTQSVGRAMFPSLAKVGNERSRLIETFLRVIGSVAALCVPMGIGLWIVAHDAVRVVLGAQWETASELFGYLAIYGMLTSMVDIMVGHVLIVSGHERRQAMLQWARCLVLVACIAAGMRWGINGIAIGAAISGAIMFIVAVTVLKATFSLRFADFLSIFWRPALAAAVMAAAVHYATSGLAIAPLPRLVAGVSIGAVSYVVALLGLWLLAGRPQGPEATALAALRQREPVVRGN